jgi:transcriptional regulator with XRE-family HTH domain
VLICATHRITRLLWCQGVQIRAIVRIVTTTPIAAVLGANCRRIRTSAGVTQDELARAARQFGLKWTGSKVRDFESGRSAPTFATVLAVTAALNGVKLGVRLTDLVSFDGEVTVTEGFAPSGETLADFCGGGVWAESGLPLPIGPDWRGLTDERVAAGLGISQAQLYAESLRLWNTTFSDQRDRIAGPDANAQRKGQVTRALKAELEKALSNGDD